MRVGQWPATVALAAILVNPVSCSDSLSPSAGVPTSSTFAITASLSAMTGVLNIGNASSNQVGMSAEDGGAAPSDAGSSSFEGTFSGPDSDGCWSGTWTEPDQTTYTVRLCPTPRWDEGVATDDAGIAQFVVNATGTFDGPARTATFAAVQTVRSVVPPAPDGGAIIVDPDGGVYDPDAGVPPPPPDTSSEMLFPDSWMTTDGGGVVTDKATGWVFRFTQTGDQSVRYDAGTLVMTSILTLVGVVDAGQEFRLTGALNASFQIDGGAEPPSGNGTALITGEFLEQGTVTARMRIETAMIVSSSSPPTPTTSGHYTLAEDNFAKQYPLSQSQIEAVIEKLVALPF